MIKRFFRTKRPFKLTRPGWVFILYTIGVGAGAINTGNNLLYLVFGVFLGLLLASGVLSDLSLWDVGVSVIFPRSMEAGQNASIFTQVANDKTRWPSIAVRVIFEAELAGKPVRITGFIPYIGTRNVYALRLEAAPAARGLLTVKGYRLSTRYPFGLLEKWTTLREEPREIFVVPAVTFVDPDKIRSRAQGDEDASHNADRGDGSTVFGVREMAHLDNPRRIHWGVSAKRSPAAAVDDPRWFVRDLEKDQKEQAIFVCPPPAAFEHRQADAEKIVSFLASALRAYRNRQIETQILIGNWMVTDETAFLALWQPTHEPGAGLQNHLVPTDDRLFMRPARVIDVLEAYELSHAV